MVLDNSSVVTGVGDMPAKPARKARLLIHVPSDKLKEHGQDGFGMYAKLAPPLRQGGVEVQFVERPMTTELTHYNRHDFHIVHHGFLRRFNVLNAGIAYLRPYWYLDQRGVLCDSSIARARPDLSTIPADRAAKFVDRIGGRLITSGQSKHQQPAREGAIGQGKIVVFLQGISDPVMRSMNMLETEMLELVAKHRGGREVLIKPHPKRPDTLGSAHAEAMAAQNPAFKIVDANVHDLLEGAYCSVSICSGAAFEGLFHHTPAILFGRADFAACAWTVDSRVTAARALSEIGQTAFDYDRFLFWFLQRKMFNSQDEGLPRKVLRRIARSGFEGFNYALDPEDIAPAAMQGEPGIAGIIPAGGRPPSEG